MYKPFFKAGQMLVMGDFNYKGTNWKNLNLYGQRESWRHKVLACMQENFQYKLVMEHIGDREGDTSSKAHIAGFHLQFVVYCDILSSPWLMGN